jgi:dienelactone hydrolase
LNPEEAAMRPRNLVMNWHSAMLAAALLCAAAPCAATGHQYDPALREEMVMVPLPDATGWPALTATTYRPPGDGPFPLIVLSHGNPVNAQERDRMGRYRVISRVREFINRGFAVIVPMRRGYGLTGGRFAESFGSCASPDFYAAGEQAAIDVLAATAYASKLSWVDRQRIVLVGQSAGGFASIAAASQRPPGVVAVVNMSGGRGGNPRTRPGEPCASAQMAETISRFARTIRVPVLWHYAENDQYFSDQHVRAWFAAFEAAGAPGTLVMRPPFAEDGHRMFAAREGLPLWTGAFDDFLRQIGFVSVAAVKY